ncbi:beta-L-arabinofuranosidase domain-containing protein, partial [Asticcacaulis sp.]|uniref:beta-L-arabinofuranosidase domain-containing protein n=1 Tax=Asticcacaulis sp. TaxID=1872648 RepID=UPI003919644D
MVVGASAAGAVTPDPISAKPFHLSQVRLKPSIFLTSIEANQRYLLSLSPDRFLHNFRKGAGLDPKGDVYGGWEARGIAGHSLGHYLSALSLMYAQTGKPEFRDRAAYVLSELKTVQAKQDDGYAGGTTVGRNGQEVDGKVVYEELRRGDIRTAGFDLNGGWVPLYTYHKVMAGTLDAHQHAGLDDGLTVATGLGDYLGTILEGLSDAQIQEILRAEHGGLTESYAELYART